MKLSAPIASCALLAASIFWTPSWAQPSEPSTMTQGPAVQARTYRLVIRPAGFDHDLQIEVTAPPTVIAQGAKLPAIYVLDGGYGLIGASAGFIMEGQEMAPAYIVSIGYPNPLGSHLGDRLNDLLHVRTSLVADGQAYGGGGAALETFLIDQLRPMLEARLPLDPGKAVLFGHSAGANFTANVLVDRPDAFAGYLIASPNLKIEPSLREKAKAVARIGAGRRVYVAYTPEDVATFQSNGLGAALSETGSTFQVRERAFEDERHRSVYLRLAQDAFPFLLPPLPAPPPTPQRTAVTIDPGVLARYAGAYRASPAVTITISEAGGSLFFQQTGGPSFELMAESERTFFFREREINAVIRFNLNPQGKATELVVVQNGRENIATRVD